MTELARLLLPALSGLPAWVTLAVGLIALATVGYMRSRGASLDEHVSLGKLTQTQAATLGQINESLNKQIAALNQTNCLQAQQLVDLRAEVADLRFKLAALEAELLKARAA